MKWIGSILVILGLAAPLASFPFVSVEDGQNFILDGFVEVSKATPRYEPKTNFERTRQLLRKHRAKATGETVKIGPYYDNPIRVYYWVIITSGIAASMAGGGILTLKRQAKD